MTKKAPSLDQEKAALYALPLKEFIAARDALAKGLKREGRAKDAAAIKALRKPSASAWLVNALIRDKGPEVRALLTAGERLRKVQREAMRGGGGGDLRAALKAEQAALAQVRRALVKRAGARGGSAMVDRALTTVRSAAQGAKAPGFDEGQLTEDVAPLGFESLALGLRGRALPSLPVREPRAAVKTEPPAAAAKPDLPRAPGKRARHAPAMKSPPPSGVRRATNTRRVAQAEARARRIEAAEAALREAESELSLLEARAHKAEEEQAKAADAAKQAADTAKQAADAAKQAADTAKRTAAEAKQAAAGAKQAERQATSARRALSEAEERRHTAERAHRKAASKR